MSGNSVEQLAQLAIENLSICGMHSSHYLQRLVGFKCEGILA